MNVKSATAKSSLRQLSQRGYIDYLQFDFNQHNMEDYLSMLSSEIAITRSLAARGLRSHILKERVVDALLQALIKEKALYTKIEITQSLQSGNKKTLLKMLPYLSIIGTNQYAMLPDTVSKKKTYPLPRDIIARTIAHMNVKYLPYLIDYLSTCSIAQARELIDAIGFMAFHTDRKYISSKLFASLMLYFEKSKDSVIRWKMVTCFSAFLPYSKDYLIYLSKENDLLKKEALRSLSFLNRTIKQN